MKVIFLGGFFPQQFSEIIFSKSKKRVQNSANKFQWAFINGLKHNLPEPVKLITAPFIGWYPLYYKDLIFNAASFVHSGDLAGGTMVGFCNLPIIKNVFKFFNLKTAIKQAISPNEDTIIIVYSLDAAYLKSAIKVKEQFPKVKICVIIPDLHEFPGDSSLLYKWYITYYEKPTFYKLLAKIDCFVVLSDKMVDYLHIEDKPWVRIEGIYEIKKNALSPTLKTNNSPKVILYTGTLDYKYGIQQLLEAFNLIKADNYKLWICGGGSGTKLVKERSLVDKRIIYYGIVSQHKVEELQSQATVLINPRNTVGEYNKYSFPSKTMEYFASGTPTIIYKLDGIPEEYFNYCYTVNDNSVETLANRLKEVCELDVAILQKKGQEAQAFILKNKSSESQCKRFVEMIKRLDFSELTKGT